MHRAASGPKQAKGGEAVIGLDEEQIKLSDLAGSGSTLPIDDDELSAAFDFFDIDGSVRPPSPPSHRPGATFAAVRWA